MIKPGRPSGRSWRCSLPCGVRRTSQPRCSRLPVLFKAALRTCDQPRRTPVAAQDGHRERTLANRSGNCEEDRGATTSRAAGVLLGLEPARHTAAT
jgi:hypothetical protein